MHGALPAPFGRLPRPHSASSQHLGWCHFGRDATMGEQATGGRRDDFLRSQGAGDAAALRGQPFLVRCWSWLPARRGQAAAWPCHARRAAPGRPAAGQWRVLTAWAWRRRSSAAWGQPPMEAPCELPPPRAASQRMCCMCVCVCGANYNTACVLFAAKVKAHELRGQSKSELQQQVRRAAAAAGRLWRAGSGGRSSGSSSTRCPSLQAPAAAPVSGIRAAHDQSRGRSMGRRASAQQAVAPRQHAPVARFPSVLTARCTPPTCPALLPACSSRT